MIYKNSRILILFLKVRVKYLLFDDEVIDINI